MARPQKIGLDYFPLDNNISDDDKIFYIETKHGITGFGVYIKLLTRIYDNGYYIEWSKFRQNVLARKVNVDINTLLEVVNSCIECYLFDEDMLKNHNILTSKAIQKRYFQATSRRKIVEVLDNYCLVDVNDYNNIKLKEVNVNINPKSVVDNDDIGTQRKEKKRKEEKSKEKDSKEDINHESTEVEVIEFKKEKIPYNKIVEMYNDILGNLIPSVRSLSDKRKRKIKARWNDQLDELEKWEDLFYAVEEQDFLLGATGKDWTATLDWLIANDNNYIKVLERQYVSSNKNKTKGQEERRMQKLYGGFLNE